MVVGKLFENVNIRTVFGEMPPEITGIEDRASEVKEGYAFFARKGSVSDGADYALEAVKNGAVMVVSETPLDTGVANVVVEDVKNALAKCAKKFYVGENPEIKIIGVVGTNGKTTICHVLYEIFGYAGIKAGYVGTIGNGFDGFEEESGLTTPGTVELYKLIGRMEKAGVKYFIMELSAHAIEQRRAEEVYFECLIFTNCTEDHLDYFKDMETYSAVKKSVFLNDKCRYKVINSDDRTGMAIISETEGRCITYGIYNPADVFAIDISETKNGVSFIINLFDVIYDISSPLIGLGNVYNLLACLATAAVFGIKIHTLSGAVRKITAVSGRTEKIATVRGADVYLDYAHTPDGLKTTLNSMRKICDGRLYCLFGCGGNRETEKRKTMGEISGVISDFSIITSDNPRYEDPCSIISEIESGIRKVTRNYISISDRKEALKYAVSLLKDGDVLVVAGKGAEKYQEVMGVKRSFSDADEIKYAISENNGDKS